MAKEIPLSQGKVAVIDDADYELVSQYKWLALKSRNGKWYARREVARKVIYLHRFIMDTPAGLEVDHRDNDGLNCQRDNMRNATRGNNSYNISKHKDGTSGYKGVTATHGKWKFQIQANKVKFQKEGFETAEAAARAYDAAAKALHGEYARLNFPD